MRADPFFPFTPMPPRLVVIRFFLRNRIRGRIGRGPLALRRIRDHFEIINDNRHRIKGEDFGSLD